MTSAFKLQISPSGYHAEMTLKATSLLSCFQIFRCVSEADIADSMKKTVKMSLFGAFTSLYPYVIRIKSCNKD